MTDDRGAAALVERLMAAEAELDWRYDDWSGRDITNAAMRRWCRAILGERGVFLPDGRRWDDPELERLRGLLGRLVSLGWLMDSLPDDELAHDLYNYDRLSPEPKP